jgi:ABC-type transport system involved in multi-copper enzyme maturation permease subunit
VRKEFQYHLSNPLLRVGMLLTLVLAAASTLIAVQDYNLRLHAYQDGVATHARVLREQTVYSFLHPVVVRRPEPLSVLNQGSDARLGSDVAIHLFAIPAEATGGYRGNEFLITPPAADLTAIVAVILGLLALLVAHDAIQSERKGGSFPAMLAHGVPRGVLLAGKILGGLLTLALPLAGALLVSLAIFVLQLEVTFSSSQWLRTAGLAASYLVYLSFMLLLGLFISLSLHRRSQALAVAVVAWLTAILVLPRAVQTLAADLSGARETRRTSERSAAALLAERDRRLGEELRRDPLRTEFSGDYALSFGSGENRAVRYRFGSAAYYDALSAYYRTEVAVGRRYAEAVFAEQQRSAARLRAAEHLARALAMASPASLLDEASEELAGTSTADYDRFLAACRSYRLDMIRYLEGKNAFASWRWFTDDSPGRLQPWTRFLGLAPEEVKPGEVRRIFERFGDPETGSRLRREQDLAERDPARRLHIDDMPRFTNPDASPLDHLRRAAPDALGLLFLNGLACTAVVTRFRRWSSR